MKKHVLAVLGSAVLLAACTKTEPTVPTTQPEETPMPSPTAMMHSTPITSERDFLWYMIPHHQEAIETSKIVEAQTTDPELKLFTQDVVAVQASEVDQMKAWLVEWYQQEYTTNPEYQPMMGDLTSVSGKALEKRYVEGMIHHHQGAIEMAQQVLTLNPRPEIQQMAEAILTVQQAEVETLQGWLATKYQDVEASPTGHEGMGH